jgi:hypothetical protein
MNRMTTDAANIPPEDLARYRHILEALERDFRPLAETLTDEAQSALVFRPGEGVEP